MTSPTRQKATSAAELTRVDQLIHDPENRRTHDARNLGMVAAALADVGAARSIVIDEGNVILAGNGVAAAAAQAGITAVRVIEADGDELIAVRRSNLTPDQKRALAIYDNRTAELAEWNLEQLRLDRDAGVDLTPYFDTAELRSLFGEAAAPGRTDPEVVPVVRATSIVPGDLFALGAHRLLCGDSTQAADVARLMDGEIGHCLFTDPPYGVAYDGGLKKRAALANDHVGTDIYGQALPLLARAVDDAAALYLWYKDPAAAHTAAVAAGYELSAEIIWAKNHAQFMTSAHYKLKHESCYFGHKRGQTARWFGPNNEVTLWEYDRAASNTFHPTQKPVALAVRALTNSTEAGQIGVDGFNGGGSTLMACEQLGRRARTIEIEPSYVQVTIDRWEAFTGQAAVKVGSI